MSVILERQFSYFFTTANAQDDNNVIVSADGSKMIITLDTPIYISPSSLHTSLAVESASIWNDTPNISEAYQNNQLTYLKAGVVQAPIYFGDGQYSLSNINQIISSTLINRSEPSNLISFSSDNATGTAILVVNTGVQIDTAAANTITEILGFVPASGPLIPSTPPTFDGFSYNAQQDAKLNRINSYGIRSDLVNGGIPSNNTAVGLIASIPITARPMSQIVYQPNHPQRVTIDYLRGKSKSSFYFQLIDEQNRPVPTNEYWSILLTFKTSLLMTTQNVPLMDV